MATIQKRPVEVEVRRADPGEEIETREGTLVAQEGDLIIEGVEGEVYPIGPEILAQTYSPRDEEARELIEECLPPGVVVEWGDRYRRGDITLSEGIHVDTRGLSEAEREAAVEFAERFMESSPNLQATADEGVPQI